ncbi:MAG: tetratricopeptide repeat protein [Bryobacteraceae bacterium]
MLERVSFACLFGIVLLAQDSGQPALDAATQAYQQGNLAGAQHLLEAALKNRPSDAGALVLMGVVLDAGQHYAEAEPYYARALKAAAASPQVLNNAANHYLATGNRERARELYLKTVAVDPHHPNANLQLAQMSVEDQKGKQAVAYLDRVGEDAAADPGVLLLRARALALTGQCDASTAILKQLESQSPGDPAAAFSTGMAKAECKLYAAAEESFSRALDADPRNFDILYNLGLAALRAGHTDRAGQVLEASLREKPDDADALYALAQVYEKRKQLVQSAAVLTRIGKLAPEHADVWLMLARLSAELEFYEDSAAAYDRYLKLKPGDDIARRERGFDLARTNQLPAALRDLEWYTTRHPRDAVGYLELAVARVFESREKAIALLNRAVELDPGLYQARYTRGLLNIEEQNFQTAVPDLELFVAKEPGNYRALAHLGQAYLAAGRGDDALKILERAKELAPDSALVLVHYRRALQKAGRTKDAAAVLGQLRESAQREDSKRRVGLVDYLSLSPDQQRARYLANLRQNSAADPSNMRTQISLAKALFADGKNVEALAITRRLASASLDPVLQAACGKVLLEAEQYDEARGFLERSVTGTTAPAEARLDLVICLFRLHHPEAALTELDKTPSVDRRGDYYLVRAQILDAQGKLQEAAASLNQGMRAAPTRATLYYQATSFLLKHKLYRDALNLLEQASRVLPDDRELLLAQVVTLDLLRQNPASEKLLATIQARWPEWDRPYLLKGILLQIKLNSAEARQALETAIALGSNTPEAYYYLALAITQASPEQTYAAQAAIAKAMALTSTDPYVYLLAGKIAIARKEYPTAVTRLQQATRLMPALVPAHYALREAYTAMGDAQKSRAELEAIQHIAAETAGTGIAPFPAEDVLFTVRPPR